MIDISASARGNIFGDAVERLTNRRAAMSAAVDVAKAGIQRNFETERSGKEPWKALSDRTINERAKVGLGPRPVLYRGGRYGERKDKPDRILRQTFDQDSPLTLDDDSASLGSKDFRVAKLSADRNMVALQREDERAVYDILIERLTRG